jgi:hypothetical protein
VNVSQDPHLAKGEIISVLVDPQAPSYSELPGKPFYPQWESEVGFAASAGLIIVALAVLFAPQFRKHRQRLAQRRARRAKA